MSKLFPIKAYNKKLNPWDLYTKQDLWYMWRLEIKNNAGLHDLIRELKQKEVKNEREREAEKIQ